MRGEATPPGTYSGVWTQMMSRWQKYTHSLSRNDAHEQRRTRARGGGLAAGTTEIKGADFKDGTSKRLQSKRLRVDRKWVTCEEAGAHERPHAHVHVEVGEVPGPREQLMRLL